MVKRVYPEPGEIWEHPTARTQYKVHSLTTDGWVRYYSWHTGLNEHNCYPLWTQPTDKFMTIYRKADSG